MAAATSQWSGDNDLLVKINVDGTNNIIKFCLEKGVKKLVYTSSIAAYAPPQGSIITEASPKLGASHISFYNKTKLWSEENVLKAVRDQGLNACILNPCQVLGKYDSTSWAQFFDAVINKKIKVMGKGGGCFANAVEVAKAHIEAVEKGKIGENYILGGPARSFMQLAGEICKLQGEPCSLKEVPDYILKGAGTLLDYYSYYWSKTKPMITPEAVERLTRSYIVHSHKAKADLKYNDEVPFEQSVQEEYKWIVYKI